MANAAAKKAAQQRKQTTSIYFPIIAALNVFHLFLLYALSSQSFTKTRIAITVFEWIGTYIAYQGIIHDAEVSNLTRNNKKQTDIAGGIYLDILGLIVLVQYGSIFIGSFIDWLLIICPLGYGLLKWFGRGKSDDAVQETEQDEGLKKELEERRRKRAERRRQKRA